MIAEVIVPDVGAAASEVRLLQWLAREGERVTAGAPLFVLETDKATQPVEAFRSGYLRRILAPVDSVVGLGDVIGLLADSLDEPLEAGAEQPALVGPASRAGPAAAARIAVPTADRILASPLARRLAQEQGVDLSRVAGSGPAGEIHKRDVVAAVCRGPKVRRVPLSPMRRAIARHTAISKAHIPHFYASITIDMTEGQALRERLTEQARAAGHAGPTLNDLILHAAARALRATPQLNATFHDTEIHSFEDVDLGVVIAVDDGVMAPVIRQADRHDIWSLAALTAVLRAKGAGGQLTADDLSGGALTVSNLGKFGPDHFTAIIPPGQAAALAVGAARQQPAVHNGQLTIRSLMSVTLSVDHRLADGVVAARFLAGSAAGWNIRRRPSRDVVSLSE